MRSNQFRRITALLIICVLALSFVGCGKQDAEIIDGKTTAATTAEWTRVGEGKYAFPFIVTFADGSKQNYIVSTDKEIVGEALADAELIAGEQSEFGLFVKTVCGVTADYSKDAAYWSLYVSGELSDVGVDSVQCKDVVDVEFRYTKG